ncbi:MAG TPA: autotransporter outer membrane beta-barrel domain-containing protein [Arenimonas sp.]|nr:autotransporter outer membrane beta-barrel domain-containing protein [Arenimonas sp.]
MPRLPLVAAIAALCLSPGVRAQSASEALDAAWVTACASAEPDTAFHARCQEILNAGPGSGGRRSAAALGNNLEMFASQGRRLMAMARARGKAAGKIADAVEGEQSLNWYSAAGDSSPDVLASGSRWALFGSVAHIDAEQSDGTFERGVEEQGEVYLLGVDYRFSDRWAGLLAIQRESRDTDFLRSGSMDADTDLLSASLAFAGDGGFGATASVSAGRTDARLTREIDYTLVLDANTPQERSIRIQSSSHSDNEADLLGADASAGWERAVGAWTWRYGADVSWQRTESDDIIEDNDRGLDFLIRGQRITSLRGGLGVEAARTFSTASGVWQPWLRLRWIHEFKDDPRRIDAAFRGGDRVFRLAFSSGEPDRNFGELGLGVSAVFVGGWQAYAGWQRMIGHSFLEEDRFDIGWRREF